MKMDKSGEISGVRSKKEGDIPHKDRIGVAGVAGVATRYFFALGFGPRWWVRKSPEFFDILVSSKSKAKKLAAALNREVKKARGQSVITKRKMRPGGGRSKGHGFEREIAKELQVIFPNARRQLEYHADDAKGIDLQNTGPYLFQCKRYREYAPIDWIEEIQSDFKNGEVPILVTQANDKRAMAVLPFDDLLQMLIELEVISDAQ